MMKNYAKFSSGFKNFRGEEEMNHETDEINRENMKRSAFLLLTKNRNIQNLQQNTSKSWASFVERRACRGK